MSNRSPNIEYTVFLIAFVCWGCAGAQRGVDATTDVNGVLDDWHDAASKADEERYMGHLAEDAIFLGTDATERWTKEEFLDFVHPYFSKGQGWTYIPRDRHVAFSEDGHTAWFDERLDNDKYGELRGTGVLRNESGVWKIVHYSMTFPIPNEISKNVVEIIRSAIRIN
jgi:ketosteroid isomerase-like protein